MQIYKCAVLEYVIYSACCRLTVTVTTLFLSITDSIKLLARNTADARVYAKSCAQLQNYQ